MTRREDAWAIVLTDIADANKVAVRTALEAAERRYKDGAKRNKPRSDQVEAWTCLGNWARSKNVLKINTIIGDIDASNLVAAKLQDLADAISKIPDLARAEIELLRPVDRDEGLIIDTFAAWTGPGAQRLVVSPEGPQQRFFSAFTSPFLGELSGQSHARYARAEKQRRTILEPIIARGEGSATADAIVVEWLPKWPFATMTFSDPQK
jgi:hypothetical protein